MECGLKLRLVNEGGVVVEKKMDGKMLRVS
jgi:hypothetical protein